MRRKLDMWILGNISKLLLNGVIPYSVMIFSGVSVSIFVTQFLVSRYSCATKDELASFALSTSS